MKAHKFGLRVVVFFQGIAKTKIWQLYHYLGKKEKEKSNDILNTISIDWEEYLNWSFNPLGTGFTELFEDRW